VPFTEEELRASNPHLYKSMIDRQAEAKTIAEFKRLEIGWTMLLDDGWWAYYNDEKALGPFAIEAEAARTGLDAWGKETAPGEA
jgi:alpha-galactosidase